MVYSIYNKMEDSVMYGFRLPEDFLIGTANSAFQSEGAVDRDGKSVNAEQSCGIYGR